MSSRSPSTFLALALVLLVGACQAHTIDPGTPQPEAPPVQGPVELHVNNTTAMPMLIGYRHGSDIFTIVGTVPASDRATFTIPNRSGDDLEISATDQNGGRFRREKVSAKPGSVIEFTVK